MSKTMKVIPGRLKFIKYRQCGYELFQKRCNNTCVDPQDPFLFRSWKHSTIVFGFVASPFSSYTTRSKLLNLSKPQFPSIKEVQ